MKDTTNNPEAGASSKQLETTHPRVTFKANSRRRALEYEKDLVSYWKNNKIFEQSIAMRSADNAYVFYDGPPFITGVPHNGTLLTSVIKDVIPRFWTMQGKRVERVWGWDCHGLPAEVFTEKKLGIQDKRDIGTKISLEEYITTCRDNMVQTGSLWEDTIDRIGRWVDFRGAYKTMDKEYMESVWWAFKTLYEKGKIYEGEKVLMYCTRDATPLAKAEIAMDNSYQNDTDPSVYVKFKLNTNPKSFKLDQPLYLLAWTTTPWTLMSNSAIAVNRTIKYALVHLKKEYFVIAESLLKTVLTDGKHQPLEYDVVGTLMGEELVGLSYEQPFGLDLNHPNAFKVWHAEFVHDEEGTGIAHESPAYGEDDYQLARENDIPWVMSTDENGIFTMGRWQGSNIWDVNKQIAKELLAEGVVMKIDYITHSYPHCYRCDTKLMYRAVPSWFMDIDGQRTEMLEGNGQINWYPEHIKHGRSEKTMLSAPDWNLSRDRFWATPLPVWKGKNAKGEEHTIVVGSYAQLAELSGIELDDYHRPWIDEVKFTIDGIEYERVTKVIDCWFESGSMPFAQFHYPFENVEKFENNFPADFIVEYVPQVRAWFYYMHSVSIGLFGVPAYKNALVHGTIMGSDGQKMSKKLGNYTDPNELMDKYSADALRFVFVASSLMNGEDFALSDKDVADVARKLAMVWNVYDFFTMYAEVDGWTWDGTLTDGCLNSENVLDTWIYSKIHSLINVVEKSTKEYDLQGASRSILPFIDDLSNWYVRRSRKRFWKSDDDNDKASAYKTLHYVLVQLSHVLAPFTPFLADELYRKLTSDKSVHLRDWPSVGHVNEMVVTHMDEIRRVVNEGLSIRAKQHVKVRQPLASLRVSGGKNLGEDADLYIEVLKDELNVKQVDWHESGDFAVELETTITEELKIEGDSRELVRMVQELRKRSGLDVDDRIRLTVETKSEYIASVIDKHGQYISTETLADELACSSNVPNETSAQTLGGEALSVRIVKK